MRGLIGRGDGHDDPVTVVVVPPGGRIDPNNPGNGTNGNESLDDVDSIDFSGNGEEATHHWKNHWPNGEKSWAMSSAWGLQSAAL